MTSILTLQDAILFLNQNTEASWSESHIISLAAKCRINLLALLPYPETNKTIRAEFNVGEGLVQRWISEPGFSTVGVLKEHDLENLWLGDNAEIVEVYFPDAGRDDLYFFEDAVVVGVNDVRMTREILVRILREWQSAQRGMPPFSQVSNTSAAIAEVAGHQNVPSDRVWDDHALRKLLDQYQQPGATQSSLAKQYVLTRQRIGQLLALAKEKFNPKKASFAASLVASKTKN